MNQIIPDSVTEAKFTVDFQVKFFIVFALQCDSQPGRAVLFR